RKSFGGAHPDDGTCNGMSGTYGNTEMFGKEEGSCSRCFGTYPFQRSNLGNTGTHGFHDLPSTAQCSQSNGQETAECHPSGNLGNVVNNALCYHGCSNNTHYFLSIISSVAEAEQCRRNKLQF